MKEELRQLLERTERQARSIIEKHEAKLPRPDQITAGVSLFYFEE
jgi:hypothetical protein